MPVSPARRIAYRVLRGVDTGDAFAADLLRSAGASLSEPDRHLATELVLGALRRRAELDLWVERLSGRPLGYFEPELRTILRLGVYQIRMLRRIPKSAAVNEAVEMAKAARKGSAAGLVNAVLRKCEPPESGATGELDSEAARLALPAWLRERWTARFGSDAALALGRWSLKTPAMVVRVAGEGAVDEARRALAAEGIEASPAAYAARGLVIERGNLLHSRLLQERMLVVQEEASQLAGSLVASAPGKRVLDLCAAPGMKTAQIAAGLAQGLLISCDRSPRRLRSMAQTLAGVIPGGVRWDRVQLDAALPLPFAIKFDRILLDAPCSGTGTLARNPEIKWRLKTDDIARLAGMQARMLASALEALAPGGRLVYATCSLESEENEEVVEKALAGKSEFRRLERAELVSQWPRLVPMF
ncbi:MAG TPA: 16S rRNA (cytosine(967)-C(5))-methyltransferase RsmB, partial [Terriglobia bacterium]|nr:16S rRNA (cytosine(967)-C(5))-methyltransferase RsmB [Terriglobia bacterium]